MKNKLRNYTFILLISVVVLLVSVVACSSDVNSDTGNSDELDLSMFVVTPTCIYSLDVDGEIESMGSVNLYFKSEESQIPYVKLSEAIKLLVYQNEGYLNLDFGSRNDNVLVINTDTKATMEVNKDNKKIIFTDYDKFFQKSYMVAPNEAVEMIDFFCREKGYSVAGGEVILDYGSYGIEIFSGLVDGKPEVLLPLRTFCDIDRTGYMSAMSYNGSCLVLAPWTYMLTPDQKLNELGELYFNPNKTDVKERNKELIDFNYKELVFNMTFNYGLSERQGIKSFDDSLKAWGLKEMLYSTDTDVSSQAICDMVFSNIGDQHSSFGIISPFARDFKMLRPTNEIYSPSIVENFGCGIKMKNARKENFKTSGINVYPGFQLITSYTDYNGEIKNDGVTAFVRFDEFTCRNESRKDYTTGTILAKGKEIESDYESSGVDTIGLIVYSNERIKEWDNENPDNKVKNVVIDLSCNCGGVINSAAFICSWLLGRAPISISSSTGAKSTVYYYSDVNMDGIFQSKMAETDDTVADKNIFVITSEFSFSCGNFVSYIVKASRKGTLLGSWTGGGECIILNTATADGTLFEISGPRHLCYESNGSFIGVDNGIDVDYKFVTTDQYFNTDSIVRRINEGLTKSVS